MNMVERIARSIAFHQGARIVGPGQSQATREFGWKGDGAHFEQYVEAYWERYEDAARMVLEAMRGMVPVIRENGEMVHELRGSPADIWTTMINAALGVNGQHTDAPK